MITKAELIETNDRLTKENTLLMTAVQYLASRKEFESCVKVDMEDGTRLTFALHGSKRADGGFIIETFHCRGQKDSFSVYLVDDAHSRYPIGGTQAILPARCAIERLTMERNRIAFSDAA